MASTPSQYFRVDRSLQKQKVEVCFLCIRLFSRRCHTISTMSQLISCPSQNRTSGFPIHPAPRVVIQQSLRTVTAWGRKARGILRKGELLRQARTRVVGHLNYYAITDNAERCSYYVYRTKRLRFTWLNRKSQRKASTWDSFAQALAWVGWPTPRIRKDLNPCRRAEAC